MNQGEIMDRNLPEHTEGLIVHRECCVCKSDCGTGAYSVGYVGRGKFNGVEDYDSVEEAEADGLSEMALAVTSIKFQRPICAECFMTDPDLCAFFNKIGCTTR